MKIYFADGTSRIVPDGSVQMNVGAVDDDGLEIVQINWSSNTYKRRHPGCATPGQPQPIPANHWRA